jgi:cytolysin (calcineurin-like family phosphatase)
MPSEQFVLTRLHLALMPIVDCLLPEELPFLEIDWSTLTSDNKNPLNFVFFLLEPSSLELDDVSSRSLSELGRGAVPWWPKRAFSLLTNGAFI